MGAIVALCASLFFFSSRRRHTRCSRDWSSDVCSSDLFSTAITAPAVQWPVLMTIDGSNDIDLVWAADDTIGVPQVVFSRSVDGGTTFSVRSEERRVGKEGRSRWSPYH